ncbi:MAG: hypothetical protein SGPRY_014936 [Prymnesium sp.]
MPRCALLLLVGQSVAIVTLMHFSRARQLPHSRLYRCSVAVFLAEAFKLPVCAAMIWREVGGSFVSVVREEVAGVNRCDTLKCCVPSLCYTVQNNLLFIALSHLNPPTYQAHSEVRGLAEGETQVRTRRGSFERDGVRDLASTACLAGTIFVSDLLVRPTTAPPPPASPGMPLSPDLHATTKEGRALTDRSIGLGAVLIAATLSGFSAAWMEALLTKPSVGGLWMRNLQLGLFSLPLAALAMISQDGHFLMKHGLLHGFGWLEWSIVLVNGLGGLLIAAVMKYLGAIVKCFSNGLAIIICAFISVPLFDLHLSESIQTFSDDLSI